MPHQIGRSPTANRQAKRLHEQAFARSGFTTNDIQALVKCQLQLIDEGKIGNV